MSGNPFTLSIGGVIRSLRLYRTTETVVSFTLLNILGCHLKVDLPTNPDLWFLLKCRTGGGWVLEHHLSLPVIDELLIFTP